MGVTGLLPLLKSIQRPEKLDKYKGETVGVDGYVWLHRGAHGCALQLAQGKETREYVKYALSRIRMMRHFGVNPYLVFDGDYLPSKKITEDDRSRRRDASRKAALDLLASGRSAQALQEAQKCVDVTPEMARELMTELQRLNVPYVVAPYEADAQLVYLEREGFVDAILSEDSDLLVFGAKRLLTKMDKYGALIEINRRDFASCREVMLSGWTDTEFRRMAIFSGCDYLKGLPQVGLKKAHGLVRKYKTPEKVVRMVMLEGKIRVPDNFLADFNQAELTFLHQRVYCPKKQELVCLTEPSVDSGVHDMPFIGAPVEPELARAIACGDVNPITKLPMVAIKTPDSAKRRHSQFAGMHAGPATAASNASVRPPMRPIESYFSPKDRRIPLGEMDTNCFSVDKQRLAALTENGRRSIVYPLPRPYIDEGRPTSRAQRRRTEPIANLLGDMGGVAAAAARLTATATTSTSSTAPFSGTTTGRPPKKARLCAETDDTAGVPPSTSKFFSKSKNTTSLQRRHTQNFPMSDDSLDEALAMVDLPDVDDWATGRSRVSMSVYQDVDIFTDRDGEGEDAGAVPADETANADLGVAGVEDDLAEESTADVHVEVPVSPPQPTLRRALTEFAYTPSTTRTPSTASAVSTARSSVLSRSSVSTWTPLSAATTPGSALRSLTPLQRIGQRALNRPRASSAAMTPAARRPAAPPLSDRARPRSVAVPLIPADPAFVPLPRVDMDEVEALNKGLGSEDLIIPASDDEEEEYGRATARVLDLGQFAYV